jgi:membrane associated rhomboid family serine protease
LRPFRRRGASGRAASGDPRTGAPAGLRPPDPAADAAPDDPASSAPPPDPASGPASAATPGAGFPPFAYLPPPRLFWYDVLPEACTRTGVLPDAARLRVWDLVLAARHVPHRLDLSGHAARLLVPGRFAPRAADEIAAYERENPPQAEPAPLPVVRGGVQPVLWAMLALVLLHALTLGELRIGGLYLLDWDGLGMADSTAILAGQWWRAVTALTLHADGAHLWSNVCIGAVFFVALARELGAGVGLLAALASGVGGNLLNALFHGPGHLSLGASTAVFGAVGALGALRGLRGEGVGIRKVLVPVAAGLAFLAMLGAGGERTDLGAHLFGFVAGAAIGCGAGLAVNRWGLPPRPVGLFCGALAAGLPVAAWILAFSAPAH